MKMTVITSGKKLVKDNETGYIVNDLEIGYKEIKYVS